MISRIRALVRREPPRHERVDLNEVISEVIALTPDQMHSHELRCNSELAADLRVVQGDRVQLQQVILNLIANAIEAMSTIPDRRRQLAIASANDGGGVRVEVRDCGPGSSRTARSASSSRSTPPRRTASGWGFGSPLDHRGARRAAVGHAKPAPGRGFSVLAPGQKAQVESAARQGRQRRHSSRS